MLFKKKDTNESSKAKTALFARKAKKDDAAERVDEARVPVSGQAGEEQSASKAAKSLRVGRAKGMVSPLILRRPRITEKATTISAHNIYTFDVAVSANKKTVMGAVKDVYNVTPEKVRIVTVPAKRVVSRRGVRGKTSRGKKAYVYLKKGDTIELV